MNGQLVAVWSLQNEEKNTTAEEWGLDYNVLIDPEHSVLEFLKDREICTIAVEDSKLRIGFFKSKGYIYGKEAHYQPAVVAFRGDFADLTNDPEKLLYVWASVPSVSNMKGATGRPTPEDVVDLVQENLVKEEPKSLHRKTTFKKRVGHNFWILKANCAIM